jgi:hypothetical protein
VKKLLLDECIPKKFKHHMLGHECVTVPEVGWAGQKNGALLSLAEQAGFQVFITLDQGIGYEQNLSGRRIGVILIRAKSSRLEDLIPHAAEILAAMDSIGPGQIVSVG